MSQSKSLWWWDSPNDLKAWQFLNSLDPVERLSSAKYERVSKELVERFGNIFFYKPVPKLLDFHKDSSPIRVIHGNNGSGKSYAAGGEFAYLITGKSPYREIPTPPTGTRVIWIITANYDIQKDSSQTILFSNLEAPIRDIGLLPDIKTLESSGVEVDWHKKHILRSLRFPDGTRVEFKSYEQEAFSVAGAAVDGIWLDEVAKPKMYDEAATRVLRKYGEVVMSCLVEDVENSYLVTDVHQKYEDDISKTGSSKVSFYFIGIEDNTYLDPEKTKEYKEILSEEGRAWRFSSGGHFIVQTKGTIVYPNYQEPLHLVPDLLQQYDPFRTVYRAWDLGYDRPACVGFQIDKFGRVLVLFALLGKKTQLYDFIDLVTGHLEAILPGTVFSHHEILPHDANRHYDVSPSSAADIFREKRLDSLDVYYVNVEKSVLNLNSMFSTLKAGKPSIMIDAEHAHLVGNCCALYTRDERTGKPKTSKKTDMAHISDAMKLMSTHIMRKVKPSDFLLATQERSVVPGYSMKLVSPKGELL